MATKIVIPAESPGTTFGDGESGGSPFAFLKSPSSLTWNIICSWQVRGLRVRSEENSRLKSLLHGGHICRGAFGGQH
jgi:hypothetical protein